MPSHPKTRTTALPGCPKNESFTRRTALICALALGGLGLLTTGCEVGPNYQSPKMHAPDAWTQAPTTEPADVGSTTKPSIAFQGNPAQLAQWWTAFGDAELNSLVERAALSNLDIRQAEARLQQARAQRGIVAAGSWPQVNATGAYSRNHDGGVSTDARGRTTTNKDTDFFEPGFDATWELDIFGGVRRAVEAANDTIEAAVEDKRDVTLTLVSEVATDYLQLRGFQRQIAVARDTLVAERRSADITHRRLAAGVAATLDAANADAQVATTESQIPGLETQAQQMIYSLSLLLALEPADLNKELVAAAPIPPLPPSIPIGLPSELLRRRPDVRRAERQLAAATANIGQATAQLFPQFSLTGSVALENSQLKNLGNWNLSGFWSVGPNVTWPVFDAGSIRSNIRVQNAIQQQTFAAYQEAVLTAYSDVEKALVAYSKEQEHRQLLIVAVAANRKAVDAANALYIAGTTNFLNVVVAESSLYGAENSLALSDTIVTTNLVALYKALGGGWNVPTAKQPTFARPAPEAIK